MRRPLNPQVVYSGRVGARMRARKHAICRRIFCTLVKCKDGPFRGHTLAISNGLRTLPFTLRGFVGHYEAGEWRGQCAKAAA